jgi:hypothetical protein
MALFLCGCTSLSSAFDVILGDARQPATRVPLYVYRADLYLTFDGSSFDGIGVTTSKDETDIDVQSEVHLDRVEIETCGREAVCEHGKYCSPDFKIDDGWWGGAGNHMKYSYKPSVAESAGSCPLYIRVYDKKALAAWGFIAFRKDEELPSRFINNGISWNFRGHIAAQSKVGKINQLMFNDPIEDFDYDKTCGLTRINLTSFELRPTLGQCTAIFVANGKKAALDLISYEEVLIRE